MKVSIVCRGLDENGSIGTVIGQGPFAPMGVVNDNIVVLAFKNLRSLRRAQIDLEQAGLVVYELAGRRLAIWRENRAWSEVVTQLGLENSVVPGRKVIFSYLGKGGLNHQEVTGQEAHCRLAEWHAKIYGNRGRKRKSFDQKRRSQYSSLLIG